jgi:hypothetical protein
VKDRHISQIGTENIERNLTNMNIHTIHMARYAAEELIRRMDDYEERLKKEEKFYKTSIDLRDINGYPESSALRRQSMEVTRRLAEMRKP